MKNYISYLVWWFHMWFCFQADLTSHTPCCSNSPTRIQTEWHTVAFWSLWQMKGSVISLTGYNIYSRSTRTDLTSTSVIHYWCWSCFILSSDDAELVVEEGGLVQVESVNLMVAHTPNSSRRVQTSWISQILKLCKYRNNLHIFTQNIVNNINS